MSRIVSVWLPRWPIARYLATQKARAAAEPVDPEQPFVLAHPAAGGPRIAALNAAAEAAGLAPGEPLADARAKAGFLQVRAVDAAADDAALRRLALWATRYSPTAAPWCRDFCGEENGADGFFLDIEGAAHLFGGEDRLIADLYSRLQGFGLAARLAVAGTPGAAWALSRFHPAPCCVLPSGKEAAALAGLPIAALRLTPETCELLRRLGFKSIGALIEQPRAPMAARFPAELLQRLDQAIGRRDEPLVPVVAPPRYHSLRYLIEPILTREAIVALASRLMHTLVHVLVRDGVGARALRLCLYRVDGAVTTVDIALTLATRNVAHVARLLDLKLEALSATHDAGFGFETIGLAVTRAEPILARQNEFSSIAEAAGGGTDQAERCAALIDTLRQRLGPHSVRRCEPVASHLPERAEVLPPVTALSSPAALSSPTARGRIKPGIGEASPPWPKPEKMRPLLLLPRAEPTEVTALVPDGPPRRFCWRGVAYEVAGAQGPERIADEWWRQDASCPSAHSRASGNPRRERMQDRSASMRGDERLCTDANALTRDYYLVEDVDGRRFWLFREGLYGRETIAARWFVHGLFA